MKKKFALISETPHWRAAQVFVAKNLRCTVEKIRIKKDLRDFFRRSWYLTGFVPGVSSFPWRWIARRTAWI